MVQEECIHGGMEVQISSTISNYCNQNGGMAGLGWGLRRGYIIQGPLPTPTLINTTIK